ncbi:MAG: tetratricopeptide repeat protein, partial [Gemmatimonas sp.]
MSTAARIDELRIKFEENPRRYFAPLANEYRKAGDLAQAIALCREHLPKQPGHMSGYIVFGQALYEAGELTEAREVFAQAIELDPENLIALQHLGNIAQAVGDDSSARRWLGRVLDADPRNDNIAAQLASLGSAAAVPPMPPAVPSYESLARATPPLPMTAIGFGVQPTPDAVMRAIDVDAVNEHIAHRTPLDLDAMDSAESDEENTSEMVAEIESVPDAFTFPDAQDAQDAPDAMTEEDEADAFGDVTMDADEASFEEGLIAANWPDTSELVARVMTPRGFTARVATPLDSSTIDEAISAFGREPGDPTPFSAQADTEDAVAEVIDEIAVAPVVEANVVEANVVDEDVEEADVVEAEVVEDQELPWLAMSEVGADDVVELADAEPGLEAIAEAFAEDARAAGNEGPMVVEARDDAHSFAGSESFADVAQELVAEAEPSIEDADDTFRTPSFVELQGYVAPSESEAPAFVTETMGELLVSQGFVARAVDVYEELVRRRPYDPVLASRLAELRETLVPQG